jgi:Cu-Zn family superoxide dismutase
MAKAGESIRVRFAFCPLAFLLFRSAAGVGPCRVRPGEVLAGVRGVRSEKRRRQLEGRRGFYAFVVTGPCAAFLSALADCWTPCWHILLSSSPATAVILLCRCAHALWNGVLTKDPRTTVAVLRGDAGVSGVVKFSQESENAPTIIEYEVQHTDANAERGMHIHEFGDNTNGCTSAGPHFNPFGKTHGAPTDEVRHVGDMGNIKTDDMGVAKGRLEDNLIKLIGPHSVVGVSTIYRWQFCGCG